MGVDTGAAGAAFAAPIISAGGHAAPLKYDVAPINVVYQSRKTKQERL